MTRSALACLLLALAPLGLRGDDAAPRQTVIIDFERDGNNAFDGADRLTYVPEHATQGETAGRIALSQPFPMMIGFYGGTCLKGRWDEYDLFALDVFVEGGAVNVECFVRDDQTTQAANWDTRYNTSFTLQPGKRGVSLPLGALNRQNGKGPLDRKTIQSVSFVFTSADPTHPATIWLDDGRLESGGGGFEVKTLFSFEGADAGTTRLEDYPESFAGKSSLSVVTAHATDGAHALALESRSPAGNVQFSGFDGDWSRYDSLSIDVYNPSASPITVTGWVRAGDPQAPWHRRHNYERVLKPGLSVLSLPAGALTTPSGEPIDARHIVAFNVSTAQRTIYLDNVRLVRGVEEVPVAGLRKFDFGPKQSAVMPGFTAVSRDDAYDRARGFGWLPGGEFARDFDLAEVMGRHRPPDDLCRDACMPVKATFAVDLPNGDYEAWLMLAPPGFGWGTSCRHRQVRAQGRVVFDQDFTPETFKQVEFALQDTEDLPGDDLWQRYINQLFVPLRFAARVDDGQLRIDLDSFGAYGWTTMVNGLAVWPTSSAGAAARWLAGLDAQRRAQYESLHVENVPKQPPPEPPSRAAGERGYVRFVHSPDREVQVTSAPTAAEAAASAIELYASPGEWQDGCVGVYALKPCGAATLTVSDLAGPDGAVIPASAVRARVLRYKALNQSAVYTILPKYLDDIPAAGVEVKPGVTRSFWLIAHVPAQARPGTYAGHVDLAFAHAPADRIPLTLTVWPIALAEPDIPIGMFMTGPPTWYTQLPGGEDELARQWRDLLVDAHEHGLTSVDPQVAVPLTRYADGAATVDFAAMDRFMDAAKAAGFARELCGYSIGTGLNIRINGLDQAQEAARWGAASYAEVVKAYFDAIREHAARRAWLPICFCTDDESMIGPEANADALAALHRTLQDNAPGFRFTTFDSVRYREHPEDAAVFDRLLAGIDTWGACLHSPRESEVLAKAGRRLWLYNVGMDRFTFGTYLAFAHQRHGVAGFFQWCYAGGGTYGHFYLASFVEAHYGVAYPSTRGLRPTPLWERIRAGCGDYRYLAAARAAIARANAAGRATEEAGDLQRRLDALDAQLVFGNEQVDAAAVARAGTGDPRDPATMEATRRAIAAGIVRIAAKLDGKP